MTGSTRTATNAGKTWKQEREQRVYHLSSMDEVIKNLHLRYKEILEPLSLIANPVSNLKEPEGKNKPERPVTPIIDSVKKPPVTLAELSQLIQRRIGVRPDAVTVSKDDQQKLGSIILEEVKIIWQDIQHFVPDSLLTQEENMELHRRIVICIIIVCEKLYLHYLHMVDILRRRRVFTDEANLTRLRAQLSHDCTKFLNILAIRHRVIADIKALREKSHNTSNSARLVCFSDVKPQKQGHSPTQTSATQCSKGDLAPLGFNNLIKLSRAKPQMTKHSVAGDLKEIEEKMPYLDLKKIYDLLPYQEDLRSDSAQMPYAAIWTPSSSKQQSEDQVSSKVPEHVSVAILQRYESMPNLRDGELLTDELGIQLKDPRSQTPLVYCTHVKSAAEADVHRYQNEADDLTRLLQASSTQMLQNADNDQDTELPPLVSATTRTKSNEMKLHWLHKSLKLLEDEEEAEKTAGKVHFTEPEFPQAATVDMKFSKTYVCRTADVQVSERVLPDSVNIQPHPPVYNDLLEEIEPSTVKWLDRNLLIRIELSEIYEELRKSISVDHLRFDKDVDMAAIPTNTDVSKCMASSTLTKRKNERIINEELANPMFSTLYKCHDEIKEVKHDTKSKGRSHQDYTSWLEWWNSTMETDAYLKYLSTQESDFLGVVFHLYNSDNEDEETEAEKAIRLQKEQLKREKDLKLAELKLKKEEFISGMWNVNSIMLGGLGKDPTLEDEQSEYKSVQEKSAHQLKVDKASAKEQEQVSEDNLQSRLERIWTDLLLPDGARLDMAIKYASNKFKPRLSEAIDAWEEAAKLIKHREFLLAKLEKFEQTASNPNRFFIKGYQGTSRARMAESEERQKMHTEISTLEIKVLQVLQKIKERFQDTVTFQGRSYIEKMKWDKVEMLYWLQQKRRHLTVEQVIEQRENIPLRLPPLKLLP
ncbi:coiled-coil domain-containing protein 87 isoform X2 [Protopterus annectens]|uniref:coiled-coil domain-containing protein 87 isoform X2 n=1 Tax=Protopterus annectens TaxID=7888 RepID=UPI001CFC3BCB|nr:coiled-coil domain-containing protein 87 isoform X2 [Protopterus annectens]